MTSIPANLPHRHVDHETGHILHVEPNTGEVINSKEMVRRKNPEEQYQAWAAQRRADVNLTTDHTTAQASLMKAVPDVEDFGPIAKQGLGRPKTIFRNPAADFMPYLIGHAVDQRACPYGHYDASDDPDEVGDSHVAARYWVDDIIHGSILTSAGRSNGRINVKARAVIAALFLSEISVKACQTEEVALRTAQRIAKAARHAAHGIASYVERHPELKADLEASIEGALFRLS
ncbi:hypothetical protein BFW91_07880 [Pseudomonas fluorescens]|jgi:hypothetical protein|uniref:hypothetical protein n=1 Tax=Pseudomonas fluorescens TaxID=294 RepID=UPI00099D551E|nr:hypothetical protein [Pseudomonas fluorescens]OPB14494.1 hypothetical protein BFW91_07880 [Pseudomonas fluorescens]